MKILNFGSLNLENVYHVVHFVKPPETISSMTLDVFCGGNCFKTSYESSLGQKLKFNEKNSK